MTKIQLRRDTAANWSTNNPTPSVGEPCFETDTGKLKIGDGSTAYNDLAYQGGGGSGDSLVKSVDRNFSVSDAGQLSLANSVNIGSGLTANTVTTLMQVGTPAIRFGQYAGTFVRPEITYNSTDGMKINARALTSTGNVMKPVTVIASEFKSGDNTTQYEVVNKSPDNNTYMAHMAMPSDKFIDLELGASGTTYTAPADGYFILTGSLPTSSDVGHVTLINRLNTTSGTDGKFTVRCYGVGAASVGTGLYAFVPAKTGDNVVATWAGKATATILRFIYAAGSEPTA